MDLREKSRIQTIALAKFSEVQPRLMNALLAHFKELDIIIEADAGALMTVSGMDAETANRISQTKDRMDEAESYHNLLKSQDTFIVTRFEENFPPHLFELNDPPSFIYYRGHLPEPTGKIVAIAGTDNPSNEGLELTATLCKKLAEENVEIVANLSQGIAAAAHLGAKGNGGRSFGVLNRSFDQIESVENRALAIDIAADGGLICEFSNENEFDIEPYKYSNRIIAGIPNAVILTEFYSESKVVIDLMEFCFEIGKMIFIYINPEKGPLSDEKSLDLATRCGVIPIEGLDKIDLIINSLV